MKISQSDFIRKAICGAPSRPVIIVDGKGKEMLDCVSALLPQCKRIGNNLNQLAHYFNAGGADTETMHRQLRAELQNLTAFRLDAEKSIGAAYSNLEAYQFKKL